MYKTSNATKILDQDIIINNLIETSKVSEPRYIMSASTAWFRKNPGKNMYDLQMEFKKLKLNTVIISIDKKDESYRLCIPGNTVIEKQLKYEAKFISNPLLASKTTESSKYILERTGYSCSANFKFPTFPPSLDKLYKEPIYNQLQWASVKFTVDNVIVNPDDELKKDLSVLEPNSYSKIILLKTKEERLYAFLDNEKKNCVSEFGISVKPSANGNAESELVVHLPTYLNGI